MKKIITVFILLFFTCYPQNFHVIKAPQNQTSTTVKWAEDKRVIDHEPNGPYTSTSRSNGNIYVAISDTQTMKNIGIIPYYSSDNGSTWQLNKLVLGTGDIAKQMKIVTSSLDSIYLFINFSGSLYSWNIETSDINFIATNITSFDAVATSNNNLHAIYVTTDSLLHRHSSSDGGKTWADFGNIDSKSANPVIAKMNADTFLIAYKKFTGTSDLDHSPLKQAIYYHVSDANLGSAGFSTPVNETSTVKSEYKAVYCIGKIYYFFTNGTKGDINLMVTVSPDSGKTWVTPTTAVSGYGDNYYFDANTYNKYKGLDLIYYHDSLQTGQATISSDNLNYYDFLVSKHKVISNTIPYWSAKLQKPQIVEITKNGDSGVFWVAYETPDKPGLYFDSYSSVSGVKNEEINIKDYRLSQNYPNPFNPSTTINYNLPLSGKVSLKVFDLLGKEVAQLVDGYIDAGNHSVNFNASGLSSGIYFYQIKSGNFIQTKKMMLLK